MSTNLSNISKLTLTDTFYNWYLKTNQIIDFIDPINVYDVFAGEGLIATRSGEGPYTVEISVQTDPILYAIDTKINTDGTSDIILNIGSLTQASSVQDTSVFAVSANSSGATIFKVPASDMLPENINGNHNFNGNIAVNQLSVSSGIINLTGNNIGLYGNITNADATWYYSTNINAWISAENLGVDVNKHIVSNNSGNAIFSFFSDPITNYGNIDLRLETEDGADQKYWSIKTNGSNLPYTLSFGHYTNGTVDETPLQLEVNGTNGGNVTRVNGSIEITNILNSEPFTQTPFAGNVPITDSVNGFLNRFTNRVKLDYRGTLSAGNVVRIATDTDGDVYLEKASASNVSTSYSIGVVESVSAGKATVITSGEFTLSAGTYTPGAIHYLQNTAGLVGTSIGAVTKPVLIATGNNSGIIIPDFSGGAGSGLNNAFTAISIQGEGTYSASGSTTLTLKQGTGINLTLNTNNQLEIAATTGLPTASTYSVYNTNASATTPTTTTVSAFSVLGRPLSGNLSSITVNPGSILGRRDDTNDNDNPVESISFTQLRSYMGFSSSAYFDTFNFKDSAGTTVKTFSSSTNQTVNIQAGANISFTQSGNTVYIAASGDFTNGTGDGTGSTPLSISAGSSTFTNVTSIDFSDSEDEGTASYKQYIKFKPTAGLPSGSTRIYATPGSDFMLFKSGATTTNFKENVQTTLELAGSSATGIVTSLTDTSNGPRFNISLSPTISVDKIKPFTTNSIIVSATTAGRETINISDTTRSSGNDSEIFVNAYDTDIDGTGTVRTSVGSPSHCVSIYADSNDTTGITYPFRFHKLIVKEIDVEDLTVANSVKENLNIRFVSSDIAWTGVYKYTALSSQTIGYGVFRNGDENPLTTGSKGFGIQFVDGYQSDATGNNTASIFHPYLAAPSPISTFSNTLYRKSLIISDKISFANLNGPGSIITPTPTIGWAGLDGGIFVKSTGQKSFIKFENDDTTDDFGNVGVRDQYSFLTYGNNVVFRLNSSPVLYGVNSFILTSSTTEGTTEPSSGLKFEVETYNSSSDGKVAVIDEVTGGLAKVRFKSIVKPFGGDTSTDPIGTLYYTLT